MDGLGRHEDVKISLSRIRRALHQAASPQSATILKISSDEVVYEYKDTRKKRIAVARCKPEELVDLLLLHVHRRYRHSMRYFGLMAPNVGADFKIETLSLRPSNRHCRG